MIGENLAEIEVASVKFVTITFIETEKFDPCSFLKLKADISELDFELIYNK